MYPIPSGSRPGRERSALREMIGFAAERLMEMEVAGLTGAAYREKSCEGLAQRNGYRERAWETRAGTVELRIPKLRRGSYCPAGSPRRLAATRAAVRRGSLRNRRSVRLFTTPDTGRRCSP